VAVARRGECGPAAAARAAAAALARGAGAGAARAGDLAPWDARTLAPPTSQNPPPRAPAARAPGAHAAAAAAGGLRASVAADSRDDPSASIPAAAITRFAAAGFRLVGVAREQAFEPATVTADRRAELLEAGQGGGGASDAPDAPPGPAPAATPLGATAVIKTADGFVYQLDAAAAGAAARAPLAAAAAAAAGDAAALAAAVAAAGGAAAPGFAPGGIAGRAANGSAPAAAAASVSPAPAAPGVTALLAALYMTMRAPPQGTSSSEAATTDASGEPSPALTGRRLSYIIGADDRLEQRDFPGFPWSAVGQVRAGGGGLARLLAGCGSHWVGARAPSSCASGLAC
jgi:hypothetical protein